MVTPVQTNYSGVGPKWMCSECNSLWSGKVKARNCCTIRNEFDRALKRKIALEGF